MRKQDVTSASDSLSEPPQSALVNSISSIKENYSARHVGCSDERDCTVTKFLSSRAVLSMIPILDEKHTLILKLSDR